MKFSEIIKQAIALLQDSGRISYRSLKLEFDLNDEQLDVLKEELIDAQEVAVDKGGKVLVWVGNGQATPAVAPVADHQSPPQRFTRGQQLDNTSDHAAANGQPETHACTRRAQAST